jgi:hypothetical protein
MGTKNQPARRVGELLDAMGIKWHDESIHVLTEEDGGDRDDGSYGGRDDDEEVGMNITWWDVFMLAQAIFAVLGVAMTAQNLARWMRGRWTRDFWKQWPRPRRK